MLLGLTIRDIVLIDRLDLAFHKGLCVLTGETGAGKSILLDALGLALGMRSESGLVRQGAAQAAITAEFSLSPHHPAAALLAEQGLDSEGESLVLRRLVGADGRSRAFVNDQPVSIGLLKQLGETVVEIQGQFEQRGLLDPTTHREALDAYGGYRPEIAATAAAWRAWRTAKDAREAAEAALATAQSDEDYLRHSLAELDQLSPRPGEENELAELRSSLMHREKLVEGLNAALQELARGEHGVERALHGAARHLERLREKAAGRLDPATAALERASVEAREAIDQIEALLREFNSGTSDLDRIEERLFALRALARKHNISVDDLPALRNEIAAKIEALDGSGGDLKRLKHQEVESREAYAAASQKLEKLRQAASTKLDKAVMGELAPLKLDKARFSTVVTTLDEREWGETGRNRIHFEVATNPGAPPGPLAKIASGGELSRFMLALKVVLDRTSPVPTLVFDEVDSGIGGAVAAAVGERLQRLGDELQVLVVTHSPQVAAKGAHHWRVAKRQAAAQTTTQVEELAPEERREEIARMLSGSTITAEARAAADSLIAGASL